MSLHGLLSVTIGVPNVEATAAYYAEFGLAPEAGGWFATLDAGRQLRLVSAPTRRLIELRVGADDADDLARAAASLARLGVPADLHKTGLTATEPVTGVRVALDVAPASPAPTGCARASSATPCWAAPTTRPRCRSSPTASVSRSATGSRA
jgi:hypothetical protein